MKVCLDGRMIGKLSGIPRHAYNMVIHLAELAPKNEYIVLVNSDLMDDVAKEYPNVRLHKASVPLYSAQEQLKVPGTVKRLKADLFHSFTYTAPLFLHCKSIVTIFDLTPLKFPDYYGLMYRSYFRYVVKLAARRASKIITSSDSSRRDVCEMFKISLEKIAVVKMGMEDKFFATTTPPRAYPRKYILNVSSDKLHKNARSVVLAFSKIAPHIEHDLVIVGRQHPTVTRLVRRLALKPRICVRTHVGDDELIALYSHADVFVFPSLYEGFGLPPLEAMACRTPVISSDAGSLGEILEDAAFFVHPRDIQHIARAIMEILTNPRLRNTLIRKGLQQARRYDWCTTARQTLDVYDEVV